MYSCQLCDRSGSTNVTNLVGLKWGFEPIYTTKSSLVIMVARHRARYVPNYFGAKRTSTSYILI